MAIYEPILSRTVRPPTEIVDFGAAVSKGVDTYLAFSDRKKAEERQKRLEAHQKERDAVADAQWERQQSLLEADSDVKSMSLIASTQVALSEAAKTTENAKAIAFQTKRESDQYTADMAIIKQAVDVRTTNPSLAVVASNIPNVIQSDPLKGYAMLQDYRNGLGKNDDIMSLANPLLDLPQYKGHFQALPSNDALESNVMGLMFNTGMTKEEVKRTQFDKPDAAEVAESPDPTKLFGKNMTVSKTATGEYVHVPVRDVLDGVREGNANFIRLVAQKATDKTIAGEQLKRLMSPEVYKKVIPGLGLDKLGIPGTDIPDQEFLSDMDKNLKMPPPAQVMVDGKFVDNPASKLWTAMRNGDTSYFDKNIAPNLTGSTEKLAREKIASYRKPVITPLSWGDEARRYIGASESEQKIIESSWMKSLTDSGMTPEKAKRRVEIASELGKAMKEGYHADQWANAARVTGVVMNNLNEAALIGVGATSGSRFGIPGTIAGVILGHQAAASEHAVINNISEKLGFGDTYFETQGWSEQAQSVLMQVGLGDMLSSYATKGAVGIIAPALGKLESKAPGVWDKIVSRFNKAEDPLSGNFPGSADFKPDLASDIANSGPRQLPPHVESRIEQRLREIKEAASKVFRGGSTTIKTPPPVNPLQLTVGKPLALPEALPRRYVLDSASASSFMSDLKGIGLTQGEGAKLSREAVGVLDEIKALRSVEGVTDYSRDSLVAQHLAKYRGKLLNMYGDNKDGRAIADRLIISIINNSGM